MSSSCGRPDTGDADGTRTGSYDPRPRRDQGSGSSRPGRAATTPSSRPGSCVVAERLCDAADLQAGWHVLDVATGSGNAAIAAARLGCTAVGVDYVPALLERGRRRAAAEGLTVDLRRGRRRGAAVPRRLVRRGDAPCSASMFAPDHEQAAAELVRVCRPGGTIALASWTPDGFIGELFRTVGAARAAAARRPVADALGQRGAPARSCSATAIASLQAHGADVHVPVPLGRGLRRRSSGVWYGPTLKAFAALERRRARTRSRPT